MYEIGPLAIQQFGFSSLDQAVTSLLAAIYSLAGVAAFFYILWGGVRYIMSGGDDKKTAGARQTIVNAIVGLILLALAGTFWEFLVQLLFPELAPLYGF